MYRRNCVGEYFQTHDIQAVLSSFFVGLMILHVIVIRAVGWGGEWAQYRSIKWSMKTIESQRSNLGSWWTLLVLQEGHDQLMAPNHYSRLTQGLGKAATETILMNLEQAHSGI